MRPAVPFASRRPVRTPRSRSHPAGLFAPSGPVRVPRSRSHPAVPLAARSRLMSRTTRARVRRGFRGSRPVCGDDARGPGWGAIFPHPGPGSGSVAHSERSPQAQAAGRGPDSAPSRFPLSGGQDHCQAPTGQWLPVGQSRDRTGAAPLGIGVGAASPKCGLPSPVGPSCLRPHWLAPLPGRYLVAAGMRPLAERWPTAGSSPVVGSQWPVAGCWPATGLSPVVGPLQPVTDCCRFQRMVTELDLDRLLDRGRLPGFRRLPVGHRLPDADRWPVGDWLPGCRQWPDRGRPPDRALPRAGPVRPPASRTGCRRSPAPGLGPVPGPLSGTGPGTCRPP